MVPLKTLTLTDLEKLITQWGILVEAAVPHGTQSWLGQTRSAAIQSLRMATLQLFDRSRCLLGVAFLRHQIQYIIWIGPRQMIYIFGILLNFMWVIYWLSIQTHLDFSFLFPDPGNLPTCHFIWEDEGVGAIGLQWNIVRCFNLRSQQTFVGLCQEKSKGSSI